jgi:hypothetical protein
MANGIRKAMVRSSDTVNTQGDASRTYDVPLSVTCLAKHRPAATANAASPALMTLHRQLAGAPAHLRSLTPRVPNSGKCSRAAPLLGPTTRTKCHHDNTLALPHTRILMSSLRNPTTVTALLQATSPPTPPFASSCAVSQRLSVGLLHSQAVPLASRALQGSSVAAEARSLRLPHLRSRRAPRRASAGAPSRPGGTPARP